MPAPRDPIEGCYETFVKYGKLGEELAYSPNPFKKPILFIKGGAVFNIAGKVKPFYGCLLRDVSPLDSIDLVQYAFAFPVGMRLS